MDQREFRRVDRRRGGRALLGSAAGRAGSVSARGRPSRGDQPPRRLREWEAQRQRAYESILAAEGSDWNWWYGPEHGSANDAEFDALYRKHLTEVYRALGEPVPEALARPIKRAPERARSEAPMAYLDVKVDGRESNYFEWLGAGLYATDRRQSAMHGRAYVLGDLHYGFGPTAFLPARGSNSRSRGGNCRHIQIRLTVWDSRETRITLRVEDGKLDGCILEQAGVCLLHPETVVSAAYGKISKWVSRANCSICAAGVSCWWAWRYGRADFRSTCFPRKAC